MSDEVFVGRKREVDAVSSTLQGGGAIIGIEGVPGVGKSALMRFLRRDSERNGFRAYEARNMEGDLSPAYSIWAQILLRLKSDQPDAYAPLSTHERSALSVISPGLLDAGQDAPAMPDGEREIQLVLTIEKLIGAAIKEAPIALLLEDLHQSDRASLRLLRGMAPAIENNHLIVAFTFRPREAAQASEFRNFLSSLEGSHVYLSLIHI